MQIKQPEAKTYKRKGIMLVVMGALLGMVIMALFLGLMGSLQSWVALEAENTNVQRTQGEVVPRQLPAHNDFTVMSDTYIPVIDDYKFPDDANNIELGPFYYTLTWLCTKSDKEWRAMSEDISFQHLMQVPEDYRGKVVTIHGYVRTLLKQDLDPGNPAGVDYNYWGVIRDMDGNLYTFQTLDHLGAKINDRVVMTGVFLKRYAYQNRGQRWTWSPMVLSRQLNVIREKPDTTGHTIQLLLVVALCLGIVYVFITSRRDKSSDQSFREYLYKNRNKTKSSNSEKIKALKAKSRYNVKRKINTAGSNKSEETPPDEAASPEGSGESADNEVNPNASQDGEANQADTDTNSEDNGPATEETKPHEEDSGKDPGS